MQDLHTSSHMSVPKGHFPAKLEGVIFDCDGVIINSRTANAMFYNKVLAAFDLPPMTQEQAYFAFMSTVKQALEHIIPEHLHARVPHVCKEVVDYQRDIMPHIEIMHGFLDFIVWLRQKNVRMAVHTNRASGMPFLFERFQLQGFFDPVMTATDVAPKPDPEGVSVILDTWNMPKKAVLFVGDSPIDQQTAAAAGISFVAFGTECPEPPYAVTSYATLRTNIEEHCIL